MENTNLKRVIHLAEDELALNYKYRELPGDLSDVLIASFDYDREELMKKYDFFPLESSWIKGGTYLLSPFREEKLVYIATENFEQYILERKSNAISEIAQLLGASSYDFKLELNKEEEATFDADGKIGYKTVNVEGTYKEERSNELTKTFGHQETYEGKPVTLQSYEKAENLAAKYSLSSQPHIATLLQKCNQEVENRIKSRSVDFSMSEEMNSSFETAFNLSVAGIFNLNARVQETIKIRKSINAKLDVKF